MNKNKIRKKRMALGLSQVQLGFLSGVSNSVISDFELGKRAPWPKARKALAWALKTTIAELFPPEGRGESDDN
jgi:transcriptional regulator with XRE-family HTH domain